MARRGRRPILDTIKKREILAILAVGCPRCVAARYVGCSPSTIQNTAAREPQFAADLERVEARAELGYMQQIKQAVHLEKYWRAATWALERRNPQEYGMRRPEVLTLEQVRQLLGRFTEIVVTEVPVSRYRQNILKRLSRWIGTPAQDHEHAE